MKKIICAGLSAALMMTGFAYAKKDAVFSDLESVEWAISYIEEMADMGFISGYEDGTFRPNNDITHLEGLVLFARAMGSNSKAMEKIVEYAVNEYGELVEEYDLAFGEEEICFMLYRGALSKGELEDYLAEDMKNEPMKRYEAAIVITKAMGAEKAAKSEVNVELDYNDLKEIPSSAAKHVFYVTQAGIMNGMDGNIFSPNTNVKRSQMAVMLSRTVGEMKINFTESFIETIDTEEAIIETSDGAYEYGSNAVMYVEGKKTNPSEMPENVACILTSINDELAYVDALASEPDKEISGVYYDYFNNDVLNIQIRETGSNKNVYYECVKGVKVTRNGESAGMADFKKGDYITLKFSNGKVVAISAEQQTVTIKDAIITDIRIEDDLIIEIEHDNEEYGDKPLNIADDVNVIKNGAAKDLSDLFRGDKVTLTLEYGQVKKIVASSVKKNVEGSIREIHISQNPYMVIAVNGNEAKYDIPSSVSIKVNGDAGTIYDFKLGDTVKITIESQAITAISVTSVQSGTRSITAGVVTAVNPSYGFIKVSYEEAGISKEETVMCKDSTTTVIDSAGKTISLKDVKDGDVVTIRGTVNNGAFVASVILIEGN